MPVPLYQAKAAFFRTIGHPVRIRVLELLAELDRPVHDLRANIHVESPNLSNQRAVLMRALRDPGASGRPLLRRRGRLD